MLPFNTYENNQKYILAEMKLEEEFQALFEEKKSYFFMRNL